MIGLRITTSSKGYLRDEMGVYVLPSMKQIRYVCRDELK